MRGRIAATSLWINGIKRLTKSSEALSGFGSYLFHREQMKAYLPKKVADNWLGCIFDQSDLKSEHLDVIAEGIKLWAIQQGASDYVFCFQPFSSNSNENFLSQRANLTHLEKFNGQELLEQKSVKLSSFNGYIVWDPKRFPYLWESKEKITLCIPALFFSDDGGVCDYEMALSQAEEKLKKTVLRLLKFCKLEARNPFSTLQIEQDYFCIDRDEFLSRPDLLLTGRTLFGETLRLGVEFPLSSRFSLADKELAFLAAIEEAAFPLGIVFEKSIPTIMIEKATENDRIVQTLDQYLMLRELIEKTAIQQNLVALFHEKPFWQIPPSYGRVQWSIGTDTYPHLLDPRNNRFCFLILLTAILNAIESHQHLLQASLASAGNDVKFRHSKRDIRVYLTYELKQRIENLLGENTIELSFIQQLEKNRSDEMNSTGAAFIVIGEGQIELRGLGSSAHPGLFATVLGAIVSDSLELILDEIGDCTRDRNFDEELFFALSLPVLHKHLRAAEPVLCGGNDGEGHKRLRSHNCFEALTHWIDKKSVRVFEKILSDAEIHRLYELRVEEYVSKVSIEAKSMVQIFRRQILPSLNAESKKRSSLIESLSQKDQKFEMAKLKELTLAIDQAIVDIDEVAKLEVLMEGCGWEAKGKILSELGIPKMEKARQSVDALELLVDSKIWPLANIRYR